MDEPQSRPADSTHQHIRVLLVDDEERFRKNLADRLQLRGYAVDQAGDGEEAIRALRRFRPDVILLDRKMPKLSGEDTLREIKRIAPETQVIMLTGHASFDSATETGRLEAFAYLEKPCETPELIRTLEAARQEKDYAMARLEIPEVKTPSLLGRLWGTHNSRPGILLIGAAILATLYLIPIPASLSQLVGAHKIGEPSEEIAGYAGYRKLAVGESIADQYAAAAKLPKDLAVDQRTDRTARAALIMIAILSIAALFWATGALPIGITSLLVGVLMYLFHVFPPDTVAKAFAKDAVLFIMGVLALAAGIAKTGLDRRIGLLLLGTSRSVGAHLFLFCPLLAVSAAFLSEHALVAFLAPILMLVYMSAVRTAGLKNDHALAVMLVLALCFAANQGGPGSPAAGGRNAVMIGILSDYGVAPSFGEWVKYGLPFVPVMALVIAAYFFLRFRRQLKVQNLDVAAIVRAEAERLGKMTRAEYLAAATMVVVIVLWCAASDTLGMGGPALLGICALAVFRIIAWRDVNRISWDVVALYASACAIGVGLASTGAALWMAKSLVDLLPGPLRAGEGLAMASSFFTGTMTNFMSDGATVSAIGPITVPMATVSGTDPLMVGLATAFASSFANILIIGTPNNAIAYSLAKDPNTGEQLVTLRDFAKHGLVITLLAFGVLWLWTIFGYWRWIGF